MTPSVLDEILSEVERHPGEPDIVAISLADAATVRWADLPGETRLVVEVEPQLDGQPTLEIYVYAERAGRYAEVSYSPMRIPITEALPSIGSVSAALVAAVNAVAGTGIVRGLEYLGEPDTDFPVHIRVDLPAGETVADVVRPLAELGFAVWDIAHRGTMTGAAEAARLARAELVA